MMYSSYCQTKAVFSLQAQDVEIPKSVTSFLAKTATPSEWKEIASCVSALVDEATFEVSPTGITFRAMDPAHVALIDILWPSSTFEKFECTKADRFTVRMEDFAKLIKRSEARDSVEISRTGNESILLKVGNESYRREFELHLLESSAKSSPLPRLSFDAKFVMSYSAFAQALNDVSTVSNHITIRTSKERVSFSGKGDVGKALATFERNKEKPSSTSVNDKNDSDGVYEIETNMREGAQEDSISTYNVEYLLKMMKSIGASSSDTVKFEYSTKMPLRLEFGLAESASKGGRIHFYLAPRVGTAAE